MLQNFGKDGAVSKRSLVDFTRARRRCGNDVQMVSITMCVHHGITAEIIIIDVLVECKSVSKLYNDAWNTDELHTN
jgi:hypothetical protein